MIEYKFNPDNIWNQKLKSEDMSRTMISATVKKLIYLRFKSHRTIIGQQQIPWCSHCICFFRSHLNKCQLYTGVKCNYQHLNPSNALHQAEFETDITVHIKHLTGGFIHFEIIKISPENLFESGFRRRSCQIYDYRCKYLTQYSD